MRLHLLLRLIAGTPLAVISSSHWSITNSGCSAVNASNATNLLIDAQSIMGAAAMASLATHAGGASCVDSCGPADINARIVSPKPVDEVVDPTSLAVIYIDTNSLSRKFSEIQSLITAGGFARANLLYYDRDGAGYVTLRGNVTICDAAEAKRVWWDGWAPFYPEKQNTSFYSVLRFVPDWLEVSGGSRENVQSGRADWLPTSLRRHTGLWEVVVPAAPSPPPSPPSPPTPSENWVCSVCQHVYDQQKDGGGKPFESLPDTFKCPICGAPKSAFHKHLADDGDTPVTASATALFA